MYDIGTKVVYPIHGIGEIKNIEEQSVLGEKRKYYVLQLLNNNMKVMLPCDYNEKIKLRTIANSKDIVDAVSILEGKPKTELSDNWRARYNYNCDKLKEGSFLGIAEVIKNLSSREQDNSISNSEKKLLRNALDLMISEIAFSTSENKMEVEKKINDLIKKPSM